MKTLRFSWLAVILILTAPSLARAQQASIDMPDTVSSAGCGGSPPPLVNVPPTADGTSKMRVRIKTASAGGGINPLVTADNIPLTPCMTGAAVANSVMDAIHTAATTGGVYTCAAAPGTCGGATANPLSSQNWEFRVAAGNTCGFLLGRFALGGLFHRVYAGVAGGCTLPVKGVIASTNAGNPLEVDLLPQYLLQVNPNGVTGNVTVEAYHTQGGANPRTERDQNRVQRHGPRVHSSVRRQSGVLAIPRRLLP